ncbi:YhgE/Pip family protein [Gordonia crocea]|nr:YhgE/Pip domain-containing protein [Gordonia crocea]
MPVLSDPKARLQHSRVARLIVAILVMVPLVVSAIYMWVLWDPTKTVKDMPVAIVNQDTGFTDDSGTTEAGAKVTDNLVKSGALNFQRVDKANAYEGLRSGRYYFVLDIPADFSENLKTITNPGTAASLITVTFNDNNTLKASQIGGSAMEKIYQSVLKGIAATTVGGLVDGVQKLGDGLRSAADGSGQLGDGTATLSNGVSNDLAPGVKKAREGAAKLDEGAGTLAAGLVSLQQGTDKLGDGATQVADGIERLTTMAQVNNLQAAIKQAQALSPNNPQLAKVAELIDGLARLKAGSREIATQLTSPTAQYRSGVNKLVDGSGRLQTGAAQLSAGMVAIDEGVGKVADGAQRLNDGANRLNQGLSDGAKKAPDFGDEQARATLAQLMATPVTKETKHLARAQFSGPGGAPTILLIASMLVPIMILLTFRGHRFVTDDKTPRSLRATGRRAVAVSAISLGVMVLVGVLAFITRDPMPEPASLTKVIVITAAATLMNAALVSVLYTLFGYVVGTLSSLAWLMLQLFSYGGIWMVETVPAPFQWLHWISPLTYVRNGYIAAFNGVPGFWSSLVTLIVIGLAGLALIFGAVKFQRTRYERIVGHEPTALPAT